MLSTTIKECRSCGHTELKSVLELGNVSLANSLLRKDQLEQPENRFPLDVVFCSNCALVQITETVKPEVLFSDYLYFSSFSDTALQNAKDIADRLVLERKLTSESLAAEVASNDGYLLKNYIEKGIPVLGIEPAQNIAKVANEKGIRTVAKFFNVETAKKIMEES